MAGVNTYACSNASILADCQSRASESTTSALFDERSIFSERCCNCYSSNSNGEESDGAEELHVEVCWLFGFKGGFLENLK